MGDYRYWFSAGLDCEYDMKTVIKWGLIIGIPLGLAAYIGLTIAGNQLEALNHAYVNENSRTWPYNEPFVLISGVQEDYELQPAYNSQPAGENR